METCCRPLEKFVVHAAGRIEDERAGFLLLAQNHARLGLDVERRCKHCPRVGAERLCQKF
jgi:hypothetical protein